MTEEKISKAEAIAKSVEKISDSRGIGEIGKGLGLGLAALAGALAFASIGLSPAASKWDGHLYPQTKCFEIHEVAGKIFKVNTCTGETVEIKSEEDPRKNGLLK
jgi:hypothetical protein